ncbi:MAG: fused MFS/spermidine synthase [Acidobacteriaceae bacterium]|nr:fused MFS/spermidine synthase [Acidobacteriaceae bacterium]
MLFSLEPLVAKRILPWFGGSAAVWSTCLVFYQLTLLIGYLYARLLADRNRRTQAVVHTLFLLTSFALLPIGPSPRWESASPQHPAALIFTMLSASIGLPFVLLSSSSPLLQSWLARDGHPAPYRIFAFSNFAALAALIAYPALGEPLLDLHSQRYLWTALYVLFAGLCSLVAWWFRPVAFSGNQVAREREWILPTRKAAWFALAACSSTLLLAVTNHIDENVAAVPLLWIAPLAIYLLTFVLAFSGSRWYSRALFLRLLAFALGVLGYAIYNVNAIEAVQVSIPIFLAGLFICCLFFHAELYRLRPPASGSTEFYLLIAAGGAAGAVFVGLLAPTLFSGVYELPITLIFAAVLATSLFWQEGRWSIRLLWLAVTACMIAVLQANVHSYNQDALSLRRSFYGSLRVTQSPHAGPEQLRVLFHGTIEHGAQFVWPDERKRATTYYGPDSGIGIVLRECYESPKRVGVVGLGVGTVATYATPGDQFRFYEINPQVVDLAQSLFFYLRQSAAKPTIAVGDARLELQSERSRFDVLAIDAFSGDAIPVHLLTREALRIYLAHLNPGGTLAFHVSNDFLDLSPVVARLAGECGIPAVLVRNHEHSDAAVLAADWVLVTQNLRVLSSEAIRNHSIAIPPRPDLRTWTDDYNNLLQVLKTQQVR